MVQIADDNVAVVDGREIGLLDDVTHARAVAVRRGESGVLAGETENLGLAESVANRIRDDGIGGEYAAEIDDAEDSKQQNRQDEGELDHSLAALAVRALLRCW